MSRRRVIAPLVVLGLLGWWLWTPRPVTQPPAESTPGPTPPSTVTTHGPQTVVPSALQDTASLPRPAPSPIFDPSDQQDRVVVRCDLSDLVSELAHAPARIDFAEDSQRHQTVGQLRDGWLFFTAPLTTVSAAANIEHIGQIRLTWAQARAGQHTPCVRAELVSAPGGVYVDLLGEPLAGGQLIGCGKRIALHEDDSLWLAMPADPCEIAIEVRQDGRWARGPTLMVEPSPHHDLEIEIDWPHIDELGPYPHSLYSMLQHQLDSMQARCERSQDTTCAFDDAIAALTEELAAADEDGKRQPSTNER